ncbi:MAG: DndE family protein [Burkholderiales bacterium]|nr:DndE family protein [Burkholderiales bacterium]
MLKGRTGVTPNILCRMAMMLSMRDGRSPGNAAVPMDGGEFNAPTLFGEHIDAYDVLLQSIHGSLDSKGAQRLVAWYIQDGLEQLKRAQSLGDLLTFEQNAEGKPVHQGGRRVSKRRASA